MTDQGAKPDPPIRATSVAVVITFHPEPGLKERLASVRAQVSAIEIIDNGSDAAEQDQIRALAADDDIRVTWNSANLGLAEALDQGIAAARSAGAAWALLLDQDSAVVGGLVEAAAQTAAAAAGSRRIAVIGAGFMGQDPVDPSPTWREERVVITSGTLVSVDAWSELGGMDRTLFLDYVDIEFCLRARHAGFRILRSIVPTIAHEIGRPEVRRLLWMTVTPTNHDARRRRSITRNRIRIWRRYWRREPGFVARDAVASVKELVKLLLFEADRGAKVRAVWAGIREGTA